jgi:hypothetical protein
MMQHMERISTLLLSVSNRGWRNISSGSMSAAITACGRWEGTKQPSIVGEGAGRGEELLHLLCPSTCLVTRCSHEQPNGVEAADLDEQRKLHGVAGLLTDTNWTYRKWLI